MKIVIDIEDELYKMCRDLLGDADPIERAIADGTPLPDGTPLSKYHTDSIVPYILHRDLGCPLNECVNAYEKAIEYLRSKSNMKG